MTRADPWKYGDVWSCDVNGCKWGSPKKTYLGLARHFARHHVRQTVEYVCPFGGYGCTKGVSQPAARNQDMKMACQEMAFERGRIAGGYQKGRGTYYF